MALETIHTFSPGAQLGINLPDPFCGGALKFFIQSPNAKVKSLNATVKDRFQLKSCVFLLCHYGLFCVEVIYSISY